MRLDAPQWRARAARCGFVKRKSSALARNYGKGVDGKRHPVIRLVTPIRGTANVGGTRSSGVVSPGGSAG